MIISSFRVKNVAPTKGEINSEDDDGGVGFTTKKKIGLRMRRGLIRLRLKRHK